MSIEASLYNNFEFGDNFTKTRNLSLPLLLIFIIISLYECREKKGRRKGEEK